MTKSNISYEPEADVLTVEISREAPIDAAREVGNMVVHFTKQNVPVLIEIMQASSFLEKVQGLVHNKGTEASEKPLPAGA